MGGHPLSESGRIAAQVERNESERLAAQLERALQGGAWHGSSWRELLEGVGRGAALRRPVAGAHTIAEIVLHSAVWHDVVRRRLDGETFQVTDAEDWPQADLRDDRAWKDLQRRLFDSGRALCERIRGFPAERLHQRRPGLEDTWHGLVIGELQHVLYHAGQVGLLRKAKD
jgi:hypothetical protein